jgi:hypothetical protein
LCSGKGKISGNFEPWVYPYSNNGEGDVTAEEHLVAFYNVADNFNIDYENVWMRFFVMVLDGEVRKWF